MIRHWRLDDGIQTLVLQAAGGAMAEIIHWGAALPATEDLGALSDAARSDLGGGSMDLVPPLSICPVPDRGFAGQPGLRLSDENGPLAPRLRFAGADEGDGLALRFTGDGLSYTARFGMAEGVLTASASLQADRPIRCHWLAAPVFPGPQMSDHVQDWHGTWIREFHRQSTPWSHGMRLRESRSGRSGHEHPPLALIPSRGATRTSGEARLMHLAWSGGHRFVAEELPDGRRQLQMGKATDSQRAGTEFESGELFLAYSAEGEAGIARALQRHIRDRVVSWPVPGRPRPVHYNCWEAVYFDHSPTHLAVIATRAAALGAERFVLDDGWFGSERRGRDDDTSSLGDWTIDRRKWPDGLAPLIDHVHEAGMSFGLWVEPEMVNRDSDLYRARRDWVLGAEDQPTGRQQYALDLSRDDVRDHLFAVLDAILRENAIDYLKWDHNRPLPVADAAQTDGVYDLIDRLRAVHPSVEIESCASGGGRIDAGILARTHRVWLSDSNDAIERLRMQHEAALLLPPAITGSHVGPRTCHSSGRVLPMAFRAWVAAQRHMGFEMDPRELTEAEAETLTRITRWWKATRDWRMGGDTIPLDGADPSVTSEIQIARDGSRFVLFAGRHASSAQALPRPQRLAGLERAGRYQLRLLNPEDRPPQSRGAPALLSGPMILSGAALISAGINLPWSWPATMWVVEGERL